MPSSQPSSVQRLAAVLLVLLAALAAAVALLPPGPAPTSSAGSERLSAARVSDGLAQLARTRPAREVEVIVQAHGSTAQATAAVRAAGAVPGRALELVDAVVARLPAAAAARLAQDARVHAVSLNGGVERTGTIDPAALRTSFNQSVRADRVWAQGLTGRGVGVAVIDTGIAGGLPDFRSSETDHRSRIVASAVVNPAALQAGAVGDQLGHGTHVAGLIAGNGAARDPGDALKGRYAGVAPEAHLIAIKADDGQGGATVADVIDGLQFAVDFKDHHAIRVVNLSLRSSEAQSARTDPLAAAVEQAWFAGLVVVAAAGNDGAAADAVSYAPGNDPYVITVGGVDDKGTKAIEDDQLAPWSSRGTTQDGVAKPEVVAPGARLVSPVGPDAQYRSSCPQCVTDQAYFRVGGTSMAAAVVSGEVALLLQARPDLTPDQVKATVVKRTRAVVEATSATGELVDASGQPLPSTVTTTTTVTGAEVAADKAVGSVVTVPANAGLEPSSLIDRTTLRLDWSRTGWSRTGWSEAEQLRTGWSGTTYVPSAWVRTGWSATPTSCADLERTGWSRTGWSRTGWSSEDLDAAEQACLAMDPTRTGWSRTGWSRTGWSTSFDR